LGVLADSFNYMVQELGALIVRVKMVAQDVENTTSIILGRMAQLVENDDIQIQQIANAAAGVEQMANFSHQVADRAQVLYNVARETRSNVQSGRNFMEQAFDGMGRIYGNVQETASKVQVLGERSREIDEIVAAISNIAYQTNRLALDAAIQSAMAGENGKGFGAVAADIRRLAERTKELSGTVGQSVRSVREDIGAVAAAIHVSERETAAGTKLIQESSTSLSSVFSTIEHLAGEIETINRMANQQLQTSSAVVQIMQGVSSTTQQNGISIREASQNMQRLARLVEQLRASSGAFKLREDLSYYTASPQFKTIEEQDNQMTSSTLPGGQGVGGPPTHRGEVSRTVSRGMIGIRSASNVTFERSEGSAPVLAPARNGVSIPSHH
jgi:methyl-accepting chemotaxis protein